MRRDRNWLQPPESILTRVEVGRLRAFALSEVLADYHQPAEVGGHFTGFWARLPLAETGLSRRDQHRLDRGSKRQRRGDCSWRPDHRRDTIQR